MQPVHILINAGTVVTSRGFSKHPACKEDAGNVVIINDGVVAISGSKIVDFGTKSEVMGRISPGEVEYVIEAPQKTLVPGFIDPHTHAVFGGSREKEFALRIAGVPYMQILKKGGGILDTVKATRASSFEELLGKTRRYLDRMLAGGTTTVEIKSGYGLDFDTEIRMLQVLARLQTEHPIDIVPTFLGAHALPPEFAGKADAFLEFQINEVLPYVVEHGLARFCDIFCEEGIFNIEQSRYYLEKARDLGLELRFHADEMVNLGGAELAAELGARSADHLLKISPRGMEAMAKAGVIATLLPATPFTLMKEEYAPAGELIKKGVAVALASDFNPGSSPTHSLPLVMTLACLKMRMTPEEALNGITINAAHSLGLGAEVGSIEVGKKADLVLFDILNHHFLPYYYGTNLVDTVIKSGKIVVEKGKLKEGYSGGKRL